MKYTLIILLFFLLIFSCEEDPADPNNPNNNIPVIINASNNYIFTIHAEEYSGEHIDNLTFTSDTLEVYISLSNYAEGQGSISIVSDSTIIFSDSLKSNTTFVKTGIVSDVPETAELEFDDFSGDLSFILKTGE